MPIRKGRLHKICKRCGKSFEPEGKNPKLCDDCFKRVCWNSKKEIIKIPKNQKINLEIDNLIFNYIYSIKSISDKTYEKIVKEWCRIKAEEKSLGKINLKIDKLIFDFIETLPEVSDKAYIRIVKRWDKMKQKEKQKNVIKKNRSKV